MRPFKLTYLHHQIVKTSIGILLFSVLIGSYSLLKPEETTTEEPVEIQKAFVDAFNTESASMFRGLFNEAMKKRNSVQKLNKSFKKVKDQIGKISSMELQKVSGNNYSYQSIHRTASLEIVFHIDEENKLSEMSIGPYHYKDAVVIDRNTTELILPFHGEWHTFWGGSTRRQNYHNAYDNMRGAFDFWVMGSNGKSNDGNPKRNEDFYAFGKELIAPTDAKVVFVSDGVKDNIWPAMNRAKAYGNAVMLETKNKEYMIFAHMKYNSIKVKEGQFVKQGDLLGQCGNSGTSTEPHLHFQLLNIPDFVSATGAPAYFKEIWVNGKLRKDYSPVRGDKIHN